MNENFVQFAMICHMHCLAASLVLKTELAREDRERDQPMIDVCANACIFYVFSLFSRLLVLL